MKIRSVTLFVPFSAGDGPDSWRSARTFLEEARGRFSAAGVEVQTTRLAFPPSSDRTKRQRGRGLMDWARAAEGTCREAGAGYVSIGPIRYGDDVDACVPDLAEALAATELVFAAIETASSGRVSRAACTAAAKVTAQLARTTPHGFGNLRFAAIANCPPGIPFFPAAYHDDGEPSFALALEAADLAVAALERSDGTSGNTSALVEALERAILPLERVALRLQEELGVSYLGVDLSPAPFPAEGCSIGRAVELASGVPFGAPGTLGAAAELTRACRSARVRRCGFSGLMLPVLEDSALAQRSAEGRLSLDVLLTCSAVCGTGLDTVPIPGDTPIERLASIVGDVSALSSALRKPLTARLFPVPGKVAGDAVVYDFDYFAAGAAVLPTGD